MVVHVFTRPGGSYVNILVVVHIHVFLFFSCSWRFGFLNRFMVFPCAWWFMWFSCFKWCSHVHAVNHVHVVSLVIMVVHVFHGHGGSCCSWSWWFMFLTCFYMFIAVHGFCHGGSFFMSMIQFLNILMVVHVHVLPHNFWFSWGWHVSPYICLARPHAWRIDIAGGIQALLPVTFAFFLSVCCSFCRGGAVWAPRMDHASTLWQHLVGNFR